MPEPTLYTWIHRGWLNARRESRSPGRLIAHADTVELAALRKRRTRPPGWYSRPLRPRLHPPHLHPHAARLAGARH